MLEIRQESKMPFDEERLAHEMVSIRNHLKRYHAGRMSEKVTERFCKAVDAYIEYRYLERR